MYDRCINLSRICLNRAKGECFYDVTTQTLAYINLSQAYLGKGQVSKAYAMLDSIQQINPAIDADTVYKEEFYNYYANKVNALKYEGQYNKLKFRI